MVSTFTPNIQIEEPARGDDVGVWDTPVNNNSTLLDLVAGGMATIALNNANVTLSAAQFQSNIITFNSTLTGSVNITFPTSFRKPYSIQHLCTGSSAFTITLTTTAAGGQAICCAPGEIIDCINDGTNIKFKSLGHRIGEYWDYAGSSVPNWVSGCTVPPYLLCNGAAFSGVTYPVLAGLGFAVTPDQRGRTRYMLDQGVGRVSSAVSGVAGNTLGVGGGDQSLQGHNHGVTDPGHVHGITVATFFTAPAGAASPECFANAAGGNTSAATTGITINSNGSGGAQNMPPLLVAGITLIRAA